MKFNFTYAGMLLCSFSLLAFMVYRHPINDFDISISHYIQQYHNLTLDHIMLWVSIFGELPFSIISVLTIALVFYFFKYKREAWFVASVSLTGLLILLLKNLFNRPRPTTEFVRLVESYRFNSFPSGHTLSYVVFFGFIIFLMRELTSLPILWRKILSIISYILIMAIPISRIYLGAHWFTDILGGFLMGLLYLYVLCYCYKKRNGDKAETLPPSSKLTLSR
jgi:membrane-associated phospholipid phosphatase